MVYGEFYLFGDGFGGSIGDGFMGKVFFCNHPEIVYHSKKY
jgi:hypothetical protein